VKPSQVAGGVLGALVAAGLLFGLQKPARPPPPAPPPEEPTAAEEKPSEAQLRLRLARSTQACEAYADPAQVSKWDQALEQCALALSLDPFQATAKVAQGRAFDERDNRVRYNAGLAHAQVGGRLEALDVFATIPKESLYFVPARLEFKKLAENVLRTGRVRCVADPAGPAVAPAARWEQCELYARLACHLGWEPEARTSFEALQPGHPDWTCPATYAPMLGIEAERDTDVVLRRAIAAKYPDAALADLVFDHALGVKDHQKRLAQLTDAIRTPEFTARQKAVVDAIAAYDAAHERFLAAMNRGDMPAAQAAWQDTQKVEAELMPAGQQSISAHAMTFDLATRYASLASQRFAARAYADSLSHCARAEAVMPTHAAVSECKESLRHPHIQAQLCGELRSQAAGARKGSPQLAELQGWLKDRACGP
jgi:tetratricopeptide (TPR) repeat protein